MKMSFAPQRSPGNSKALYGRTVASSQVRRPRQDPQTIQDIITCLKTKNRKIKKQLMDEVSCLEEESMNLRVYMSRIEHRNHFLLQTLKRMLSLQDETTTTTTTSPNVL
jgi:hypothetical protein